MLIESRHHSHDPNFYIREVLGINTRNLLLESADFQLIEARILREHLLLEGWLDSAKEFLKDKSEKAFEKIKEKGVGVVDAMKQFPGKVTGIVAAFYKILTDPKEAKAYLSGTLGSARHKGFKRTLLQIAAKLEEYNLNSFAKAIKSLVKSVWGMLDKASSIGGWKGFFGVLAFGMAVEKIKDEFGEVINKLKEFLSNPADTLREILGDAAVDQLKSITKEKTKQALLKIFGRKEVQQHIAKLMGFTDKAKEMVTGALKKLAGSALESLSGPVGWLKTAGQVFQASDAVLDAVERYLSRFGLANETLIRRFVRQTIITELSHHWRAI
jgi:uncharacterized protein YgfB (UPF0149 family)